MEIEVTPEPDPEERDALVAAFERLLAEDDARSGSPYLSPWRRAGIAANLASFDRDQR